MATYTELSNITSDAGWSGFLEKIKVASVIKATAVIDSATPTANQLDWAKGALLEPNKAADQIVWYVIGSNDNLAIATILGATDSAIQTNVNSAVDVLYT